MVDPNSPLLTLPVLDTALRGATDPAARAQILAAKVQVLQRETASAHSNAAHRVTQGSGTPHTQIPDPTCLWSARLDLADAYLGTNPPDVHAAAAEASVVEADCKRLQKRVDRIQSQGGETEGWMGGIRGVRKRAVLILAHVDGGLGRASRAERWKTLAEEL